MAEIKKRKFLFLYLNTGSGHITPALRLKNSIQHIYADKDYDITIMHGFSPKQKIARLFFESGYHASSAICPAAYSVIYEINQLSPVLSVSRILSTWKTLPYLQDYIKQHDITDVVSFHFVLSPPARRAIRRLNRGINFTIIATDPFSIHRSWFEVKDADYVVFSQQVKDLMHQTYGIPGRKKSWRDQDIKVFPFILSPLFKPLQEYSELRKTMNLPLHKKIVLVAGGGEGLPNMMQLISHFALLDFPYTIVAICGRNSTVFSMLTQFSKMYPKLDLRVHGFVKNMHEFIQISDCVVTKAGASTVMEVLACQKPIIFSTYIHGQELGNVRFVVNNKVGWFLRSPKRIYEKIQQLFNDQKYYKEIQENYKNFLSKAAMRISPATSLKKNARPHSKILSLLF